MALCAQHSKKLAAAAATSFQGLSVLPSTPCSIATCCMLSSVCALHPTPISPDWLPPRLWCGSPGPSTQQVDTIDTQDLLEGGWQGTTALLVMPGGADLPYCRRLNGRGNKLISGGDCGVADTHAGRAPISQTCCFHGLRGNHFYQAAASQLKLSADGVLCSLHMQPLLAHHKGLAHVQKRDIQHLHGL